MDLGGMWGTSVLWQLCLGDTFPSGESNSPLKAKFEIDTIMFSISSLWRRAL